METQFHIFEITKELVESIMSKPYDAHLHNFEELIIVTEGSLEHFIDFKAEIIEAPVACYISMGKMHKLIPHNNLRGWIINYKSEFIPESKLNFYSNFFETTNVPLSQNSCFSRFIELCRIIQNEYNQNYVDYQTISHLTSGLISMIDSERKRNLPDEIIPKSSQITVFNTFLRILEENYKRAEGVAFYADKMNMSDRNLNIICKNNFQKSVSEIIETRKLIEAKRMLLYTNKSVSEIGFELGYNEKSYFTRVFRNKTDITPTEFREISQNVIS
jgi:AraC family transcriptional regulator, transcriptional activator of pobA